MDEVLRMMGVAFLGAIVVILVLMWIWAYRDRRPKCRYCDAPLPYHSVTCETLRESKTTAEAFRLIKGGKR